MKTYLVGGAVRDELLKIPHSDRDWVVVGASPDEMADCGYRPVGKDFPVFLHPSTHEEYALARTERKTAAGYHGFAFNTSKDVTLEQDLQRRDLTINAIAKDENGELIDPWGGVADLHNRVLRHVSPAFAEDPLRVLRVARFAAKLAVFGFTIAEDTLSLMRELAESGELQTLAAERLWQEIHTTLGYAQPEPFFSAMRECGALAIVFPELDRLHGVPQTPASDVDMATHTMATLRQACLLTRDTAPRFAVLCHDLGKGDATAHDDDERGAELCKTACARLKTPAEHRELAMLTARFHRTCHSALELAPDELLRLLEQTDALRRRPRFEHFLMCCTAVARSQADAAAYQQADYLRAAIEVLLQIDAAAIAAQHKASGGPAVANAIRQARLAALSDYRESALSP